MMQALEYLKKKGKKVAMAFEDIRKACDRVNRRIVGDSIGVQVRSKSGAYY